jgi:C-terminal processing protease CtpA/Prc
VKVNPKKIALLINKNTVSSGELFTILARQSDKVIVMGTNSGGMMDYGNVVTYKTSFPTIKIQLPINRQLWLDNNFSVDKEGLKPDVYLKEDNWIEQAIKLIKE